MAKSTFHSDTQSDIALTQTENVLQIYKNNTSLKHKTFLKKKIKMKADIDQFRLLVLLLRGLTVKTPFYHHHHHFVTLIIHN